MVSTVRGPSASVSVGVGALVARHGGVVLPQVEELLTVVVGVVWLTP